jgi:hypothetical protein
MNSLEEIGALLGFVAFAGLAVLVFLTFQQARHLRRLRDWAGRAPERAAALAAREEEPELDEVDEERVRAVLEGEPGRLARLRDGLVDRWEDVDRRMPVEPKLLFGGLAAIILGVGIATGGFGVLGGGDDGSERASDRQGGGQNQRAAGNREAGGGRGGTPEVAVLNGTAPPGGTGVAGVAERVSGEVEGAGFEVGAIDNADSFASSTVMWTGNAEDDAEQLADSLEGLLGPTAVAEMTPEIEALAGGADLALIVGQDDAGI